MVLMQLSVTDIVSSRTFNILIMNKTRNNHLVKLADEALREQTANPKQGVSRILNENNCDIEEAYNGSIASLGVSIAMSELRPSLAIYYQDKPNSATRPKANRRSVLDVIARIITKDNDCPQDFSQDGNFAENFFRYAVKTDDAYLKQEVIECAIALKQVVRTYNLV